MLMALLGLTRSCCTRCAHESFYRIVFLRLSAPSIMGATENSFPRATGGGVLLVKGAGLAG
jgi:hypothetical protein